MGTLLSDGCAGIFIEMVAGEGRSWKITLIFRRYLMMYFFF